MVSIPERGVSPEQLHGPVDIDEATRQLELAAHDIAVASSCIGFGDLNEAHTNVITARASRQTPLRRSSVWPSCPVGRVCPDRLC